MPCVLYSAPKNVTLSLRSSNFLLFSTNPFFWQMFKRLMRLASWSSWSTPKITMSLVYSYDSWALLENGIHPKAETRLGSFWLQKGIRKNRSHPRCELNVVKREASCVRCIWRNAFKALAFVYTVAPASFMCYFLPPSWAYGALWWWPCSSCLDPDIPLLLHLVSSERWLKRPTVLVLLAPWWFLLLSDSPAPCQLPPLTRLVPSFWHVLLAWL